jgi:hypothetical protein
MRITTLKQALAALAMQRRQIETLDAAVKITRERLNMVFEGLGGTIWRSQVGHARFLAILSDGHLRNIIEHLNDPSERTSMLCTEELERREIDAGYRAQELKNQARAAKLAKIRKTKAKRKAR